MGASPLVFHEFTRAEFMSEALVQGVRATSEPSVTAKFVAANVAVRVVDMWAARNPLTKSLADKLGFLW
jgi:hypothetical protein